MTVRWPRWPDAAPAGRGARPGDGGAGLDAAVLAGRPGGRAAAGALAKRTVSCCAIQAVVFWRVGLYRGVWRFASVPTSSTSPAPPSSACCWSCRSSWCSACCRTSRAACWCRIRCSWCSAWACRAWSTACGRTTPGLSRKADATRVLILGAGRAGEMLLRELRGQDRYHPVGLLDDTAALKGAKIQGVEVLGTLDDLAHVARETAAPCW